MPSGYTLPVFACASAIAALRHLQQQSSPSQVTVNLIKPTEQAIIDVEQVAKIDYNCAIAITRSDPGDHLDLTRNTPIWGKVSLSFNSDSGEQITIAGGEGIGQQQNNQNQAAIYGYAQELIKANLQPLLEQNQSITVTIILPEGVQLAKRTSNEAFGVVEGLSLLGTTGIVQPLTSPSQLSAYQAEIKTKAKLFDDLVFCIGENGIDLAQKSGIDPQRIIKTANWLGSMLVTAAAAGVKSILLFGYHGKLIKLAGGIFHTHNHLADGRLEIMTAYCAKLGLSTSQTQQIFHCSTTEAALNLLRQIDQDSDNSAWVDLVYQELTQAIDLKCQDYICKYTEQKLCIGSILFDRSRKVIKISDNAVLLLPKLC
ncbi:cobalt-precorrin-5B (C(1))-methyltransferase [Pleurocapsa sp. CCALA 161]|uniref:cobalt-precorrin-5B (C(1))-methyltransferase CbiD n=1 Tax=Pleurocapsa sp. CCALA 161 TaxID=2107688 RepID=UPI000D06F2FF|nr:cobalt-precorrin-5B (C(1))-methyltransferase CbiD [Pleurocapsa sp. CCALA 161]PSB07398.1 cobalt-precorrin-5B (C(1))-methyltransferase [Pleurocapsa sp. CCALA 161]